MSMKIWRVEGKYRKHKRVFVFGKEMMAEKESHVREKIMSELGSRHRVQRKTIEFDKIQEIKPEEVTDLNLRKALGLETEF